jgi:hypothetical protein
VETYAFPGILRNRPGESAQGIVYLACEWALVGSTVSASLLNLFSVFISFLRVFGSL